jgi:hypothetical protein
MFFDLSYSTYNKNLLSYSRSRQPVDSAALMDKLRLTTGLG